MKAPSTDLLGKLTITVFVICTAPLTVLIIYYFAGIIGLKQFIYAGIAVIVSATFFAYLYIAEISELISYMNNLAEDKLAKSPEFSFLSIAGHLSGALDTLHSSWEKRNIQLEVALLEREILLDILPDLLLLIDKNGKIIKTNIAAREELGDMIVGKKISEVINDNEFLKSVDKIMKGETSEGLELLFSDKAEYFSVQFRNYPNYSKGEIIAVVAFHNITRRKQIEKMQSDFIANISHEMRTPLVSFIGFIETIQSMGNDDEKAKADFLNIMAGQARRMSALVDDLLSLSKLKNPERIKKQSISFVRIAESVVDDLKHSAKNRNMDIVLTIEKNIPNIMGDEVYLSQVLENLITNAIKYASENTVIKTDVRIIPAPRGVEVFRHKNKVLCISVEDEGAGISAEHLSRLTERFYRVDIARSRNVEGTGLGLSIVDHILTAHQGHLKIESEVGKGSKFIVYLPID